MFGNDRNQMRLFFLSSWKKFNNKEPLESLEAMIAGVIAVVNLVGLLIHGYKLL